AYFIKQFISHGLANIQVDNSFSYHLNIWKKAILLGTSISIIGLTAIILGMDFEQGVEKAYFIQNNLSDYQMSVRMTHDPDEHLARTLVLLNNLQQSTKKTNLKMKLGHLLTF